MHDTDEIERDKTHGIWDDASLAKIKTTGVASGKSFEMNSKTTPELARRNLRLFGRLVIGNFQVNINLEAETTFQESFYRMASYSNEVYIFPE